MLLKVRPIRQLEGECAMTLKTLGIQGGCHQDKKISIQIKENQTF